MKFSTIIFSAGLIACVVADATTTSTEPFPTSSYDDPTVKCLAACAETDVSCRATCLGVPTPSEDDVNKSTQCAMKCDQGSGSPEDTKKYGECQFACYSSYFLPATTGAAQGGATGTDKNPATATATGTGPGASPTGAKSGTGGSNTPTGKVSTAAAAPTMMVGGTFVGFAAAVAAAIAL